MGPRKRPRQDDAGANTAAASIKTSPSITPLQPSQATTTSQVSSLSAAPSTPSATPRRDSVPGMPPISFPRSESRSNTQGGNESRSQGNKVIQKTRSWYGSLSRKSTASLSIQKETIAGSPLKAGSTPDFHRYDLKRNGDTASLSGASQASGNTLTKLDETAGDAPDATTEIPPHDHSKTGDAPASNQNIHNAAPDTMTGDTVATTNTPMSNAPPTTETPHRPSTSSGWLGGWFGRAPAETEKPEEVENASQAPVEPPAQPEPLAQEATASTQDTDAQPAPSNEQRPATYWFNFWSNQNAPQDDSQGAAEESATLSIMNKDNVDTSMEEAPPADPDPYSKPSAGSTWAFWSRDQPKAAGKQPETPERGELAVVGERSERHPKRANSMDISREAPAKHELLKEQQVETKTGSIKATKKGKKNKPQSINIETTSRPQTPQSDTASIAADSPSKSRNKAPGTATKTAPPNLLLPSFRGTYRMKENPSILKQIASLLLRTQQPPTKHVFLSQDPPKIKKALAIGVHGLFPAAYLRHLIGQPTGTSIKFANQCAEGIRRWADSHGCEDCEIEKVALEGEGKIEHRVENLWNLLLNWTKQIREADLIVVACHSQGVPVSIMLLAKLIDSGIIKNAKIGVCAMAGVNLGPFPDYKGGMGMLMGSAAELWEFANSESEVSKRYEASLKDVLAHGVRITFVGSIDDQLVPIESAIYSPASHPYIYRAIFIDGRIHAPDFIAHLVGFACKLRNLGVSDHGLIRELSVPLAGSLYGGEGHSRLYDDGEVYDLAISHCLETTHVGNMPCEIQKYDGLASSNPYHLPWIMRGLLEEDFVKTELSTETEELLRQFDDWKPTTKALKDVKYRLEAVRSKL